MTSVSMTAKPPRFKLTSLLIGGLILCMAFPATVFSAEPGDWPGWRGPERTGVSKETGLLKQWPEGGPNLLWKIGGLGSGHSTPSIAQGRIFLMGTIEKNEALIALIALDVRDGKQLWATPLGRRFARVEVADEGPRSTPTVDGEMVYALTAKGQLACLETSTGAVKWNRDLPKDFSGKCGRWGYAESPLIDGDRVVCTPGGESATLVALNKLTGELILKAAIHPDPEKNFPENKGPLNKDPSVAAYSSIIVANHGGVKQYIRFVRQGIVGVSAEDGSLLWRYDKPANVMNNISTPLFHDGAVFAATGYGKGGGRANLKVEEGKFSAEEAYFVRQIQNHYGGLILVDEHVYGTGSAVLMCIDYKTGKIKWNERGVGKGSLVYADGHHYVRGEGGYIALVEATPAEYKEKGRFLQPDRSNQQALSHPVVAGGKLYIRDGDALLCYDVQAKTGAE